MTPERIAELRAEYKSLKRHLHSEVTLATSDFDELLAAAERYAELRDDPGPLTVRDYKGSVYQGEHLDAAIDAARKGGE